MASSAHINRFTFTEVDEVNHPTATYIYSEPSLPLTSPPIKHEVRCGRIDVMVVTLFSFLRLSLFQTRSESFA